MTGAFADMINVAQIPHTLDGERYRRFLRSDYSAYVRHVNPGYFMSHFHKFLCDTIQEFLETPCERDMDILLLSVPPQHGKSHTITATLPSWFLGNHPTDDVIIAGYETSFSEGFNRSNRDKYNEYAASIWPDAGPDKSVQGVSLWKTALGGECYAAGLKAGITGHGAELFIIDDPIKNKEQADSETVLAKIHDEMGPSVQSRIHPGGKLIVIQTRWVEGDVIGWIESNWGEWIWRKVNLPCEYDEDAAREGPCPLGRKIGDALIGEHLGDDVRLIPAKIRVDNRWLKSKKLMVIRSDGARTWDALYQGRPSAAQGNLYKATSWRRFERTAELRRQMEYMQLSVDATFKGTEVSDFVAMELWGLKGRSAYMWKLVNKRMGFVDTLAKLKTIALEYTEIDELVIEDKANGSAIIDTLHYTDGIPPVVAVTPKGGKYARAQVTSDFVEQGNAYLPSDLTPAEEEDIEWGGDPKVKGVDKFIEQHRSFPFGKNDDMVDGQTQGLTRIIKLITGEVPMPKRKHVRYTHWYSDMWEDYYQLDDDGKLAFIAYHGAPEEWQDYEERVS